jgi:hypothetical protein
MGATMKRVFCFWLVAIVISVAASTIAAAQSQPSLGDYARAVKKTKNPPSGKTSTRVYDNDNLPTSSSLSVVGQAPEPATDPSADQKADQKKDQGKDAGSQAKDAEKTPDGKAAGDKGEKAEAQSKAENSAQVKPGQAAEERQKALEAWKARLDEQKDKISLLSRELDVLQREHDIKATEFYANTARRVQNPNGFASEDAKYKQQIADKQKAVDAAKAKLTDMKDEARKSGAPNSVAE